MLNCILDQQHLLYNLSHFDFLHHDCFHFLLSVWHIFTQNQSSSLPQYAQKGQIKLTYLEAFQAYMIIHAGEYKTSTSYFPLREPTCTCSSQRHNERNKITKLQDVRQVPGNTNFPATSPIIQSLNSDTTLENRTLVE